MADVIATVWDFDKTLIEGYMQEPIFKHYDIDSKKFWKENNEKIDELKNQGLWVNSDTYYLNSFLKYVRDGRMKGLNNELLKKFGQEQNFYQGVEKLFKKIVNLPKENQAYRDNGIIFENYIVSSGLKKVIEGTKLMPYVKGVWGCEFAEKVNSEGENEISEITYFIDNTTKTRALFEINKGANIADNGIDVNSSIKEDDRRVQFLNMIYVADGPSDIPAFSVINKNGGATLAVYPSGNQEAFHQVDKLRTEQRVDMYAEADYREDKQAYLWIMEKLKLQAEKIIEAHKATYKNIGKGTPKHLI